MKNLKKVLALVLAFACAFTMMAGAVVYPDVPAGSDYSEAITMLSDLGVITGDTDGKYHPERTITRAEACALIARLLTGETDVSKYQGASNFADVAKTAWYESAVGYCVANGIVRGYPDGTFKPAQTINDAEFVTMLVRAMGYETAANPLSFPYGYISAAQTAGLLEDVTVVPASGALRGEDAQMMYNALFADFARGAKFVNTTHGTTIEEYPTIAEAVFGLTRAAVGTADKDGSLKNCKAHTWVIAGKLCAEGYEDKIVAFPIEDGKTDLYDDETGYLFTYEGDVDALVGYQVELWGEGVHGQDEYDDVKIDGEEYIASADWDIKAIKTVKGQTATAFNPTMADDKVDGTLKLEDVDVDLDNVQNSDKSDKELEKLLNTKNSYSYNVIDWDSDGSADFIDASYYTYFEVESMSSKSIKLIDTMGNKVTLDKDGETSNVEYIWGKDNKRTVKAELPEDVEEGDILSVKMDCVAEKKDVVSTWTVEIVEADSVELTKISSTKGAYFDGELVEVADKDYNFDNADETYNKLNEKSVDNWDLWKDANGYIIKMAESSESYDGYMYVLGAANGDNTTAGRKYAKVTAKNDKNEKMTDVELTSNATVKMADAKGDLVSIYDDRMFDAAYNPLGHVFKYKLNEDGDITKMIEVAYEKSTANAQATGYTYTDKIDSLEANFGTANEKNWMDSAKVIFVVEVTADEYSNSNVNDVNDGANNYDVDEKDLSASNVLAVKVSDIPDIEFGGKTEGRGVRVDVDENVDDITAAVLGVNTFRYFGNTSISAGLLTGLTQDRGNDIYEVEAIIAGRDDTDFVTIDEDDVEVEIAGSATNIDKLHDLLHEGKSAKNGIYAEFEFNADGKIVAINPMDLSNTDGVNSIGSHNSYEVARVGLNSIKNSTVTYSYLHSAGADSNAVYTYDNGEYNEYADLTDKTEYYIISKEEVKLGVDGSRLNAYKDAFNEGFKVEETTKDVMANSYIRNNLDEDEYAVVDLILDGGDVVAAFCYDKLVEEKKATVPADSISVKSEIKAASGLTYNYTEEIVLKVKDTVNTGSTNVTLTHTTGLGTDVVTSASITNNASAADVAKAIADEMKKNPSYGSWNIVAGTDTVTMKFQGSNPAWSSAKTPVVKVTAGDADILVNVDAQAKSEEVVAKKPANVITFTGDMIGKKYEVTYAYTSDVLGTIDATGTAYSAADVAAEVAEMMAASKDTDVKTDIALWDITVDGNKIVMELKSGSSFSVARNITLTAK